MPIPVTVLLNCYFVGVETRIAYSGYCASCLLFLHFTARGPKNSRGVQGGIYDAVICIEALCKSSLGSCM